MEDENKSRKQLISELKQAHDQIAELEKSLSKLKRADAALRKAEEMFSFYFELSNDIMFSYNNLLNVLYVSPNVERITGYKPEELIGKNFEDLQLIVPPDDIEEVMDNAQNYLSGKTVYPNIYRFITKNGEQKLAEVDGFPITRNGKVVAMVSLAKDITKHVEMEKSLRESEQKCRLTLQHMPSALNVIKIQDARYLYVNDYFCKMTGYSPDEIIGKTLFDLDLPVRHADYEVLMKSMKYGDEISKVEHLCQTKEGTILETLISAKPVYFDGEDCLLVVMTDISSIKQNENERKKIDIELAQTQKKEAIKTLAGGIAHDFNNILTAIIGYTKMAKRDVSKLMKGNEDLFIVKEDLKEVRNAALRASQLVNQFLAYSEYAQKNETPILLNTFIRDSLDNIRPTLPKRIKIKEDLVDSGTVLGDPVQIHQVIMNLCTNAVFAMGEKDGVVDVSLKKVKLDHEAALDLDLPSGAYLKLTVHDTGGGMSPEVMSRIYEPYFTTGWNKEGSGLGLSVAHGIVKNHGGSISCKSSPEQGTTFDIYLPEIEPRKESVETLVKMSGKSRSKRILNLDEGEPLDTSEKKTEQERQKPIDHKDT